MSDLEYVMVMHNGGRATKFMSEAYCKNLMEALAAAQSQEVCTVPHSDEVMEFCPYCKIERLAAENAALKGLLLDGKLIAQRTISETLGCGDHQEMLDDWIARIDAALTKETEK